MINCKFSFIYPYFQREPNIDEVIQTHEVFANVSKGQLAKKSELFRDFETEDIEEIVLKLLQEGEIPVSEMERKSISESLSRDVAKIISEKCVNTETNRPYTVSMVEKMMKECHINLQPNKSAKHQVSTAFNNSSFICIFVGFFFLVKQMHTKLY